MAFELGVKQFNLIKVTDKSSNVLMMSHEVEDGKVVPADIQPSENFILGAKSLGLAFPAIQGSTLNISDLEEWCIVEGYKLYIRGIEEPRILTIEEILTTETGNVGKGTLIFSRDISFFSSKAETKSLIKYSVNMAEYKELDAADEILIAKNTNLVITINAANILPGQIISFSVGERAIKDSNSNANFKFTTPYSSITTV